MKTNTYRFFEILACLLLTLSLIAETTATSEQLNYWIPFQLENEAMAINTTDFEIIESTNAQSVFSVDYVNGQGVVAALFATKTSGETFDGFFNMHSRLNAVEILDVFMTDILGNEFIISSCLGADGSTYYNTCYSFLRQNPDEFEVESFWNKSQYQRNGTYLNYEIKSTSLVAIKEIIQYALDRAEEINVLKEQSTQPELPKFYVSKLNYLNGKMDLQFKNPGQVSDEIKLNSFTRSLANLDPIEDIVNIDFTGELVQEYSFDNTRFYDCEMFFSHEESLIDEIYIADGLWIVSDQDDFIEEEQEFVEMDPVNFYMDRNIKIQRQDISELSVIRNIHYAGIPQDIGDFDFLAFDLNTNQNWIISLQDENGNKFHEEVLMIGQQSFLISLDDFKDEDNEIINLESLRAIQFKLKNEGPVEDCYIEIKRLRFTNSQSTATKILHENKPNLIVFPNPSNGVFTIQFDESRDDACVLRIYNSLGAEVFLQNVSKQNKVINVNTRLKPGIYFLNIHSPKGKTSQKIIIK